MATKLKTSSEKAGGDITKTNFTCDQLMKIHRDKSAPNFGWMGAKQAQEFYGISGSSLKRILAAYSVPTIFLTFDTIGISPLISQPALEHVFSNSPELVSTTSDEPAQTRLDRLKAEAEAEVKEKHRKEFEKKLATV